MTDYDLLIGDRSYSSWSLRGWLAFRAFGIPVKIHTTRFYQDGFKDDLIPFFPAKTVPVVKCSDGSVWTDSVAIVEELHSRHPEAGLLPSDPVLRAKARSLIAEMHSGFQTLRNNCPMNTRTAYVQTPVSEALASDLARIELLWRDRSGPWLCGDYSMADAFYAPVAARIAGYALPVSEDAQSYVQQHLEHAPFRQFRAMGLTQEPQEFYVRDYPVKAWPGPAQIRAQAVDHGPSENDTCLYSGDSVTHFLEIDGRVFGFCNAFCRDKTVPDPAAWPQFLEIFNRG